MKLAITQRVIFMDKGANRDALEQDYVEYYQKYGFKIIPIPNVLDNIEEYFKDILPDRIILSGGNDINPKLYGEESEDNDSLSSNRVSEARDKTDKKVLHIAIKRNIPVLCECRGMQFLNVYFGGKLIQNIGRKGFKNIAPSTHKIILKKDVTEKYHELNNNINASNNEISNNCITVNSFHNHGFTENELSSELKVFAATDEGIIEGVFHPKYPLAGIMWHPERPGCDIDFNKKIISAFIRKDLFWNPKSKLK